MNEEARQELENFQEELREMADREEISYTHDGVYGMAILLDSVLNEDLTVEDAVNEFIENSDLEIKADTEIVNVVIE